MIAVFVYILALQYQAIFNSNRRSLLPDYNIYEPEQAGKYLRDLKTKHPEYKDICVINSYYPRVLQFYANKYAYLDGTKITIYWDVPDSLKNQLVFSCEDKFKSEIESEYNYTLVDSARYAKLYFIKSLRDTVETANKIQ